MRDAQNAARAGFQGISATVNSVGDTFTSVGATITKWTAPIAAVATYGTKVYGDFDEVLSEVQARTGATAKEMDNVRAVALQMGQDTSYSASQAATAILELLSSGYDLKQTFQALPAVLNAAAAGGLDLGYTADVVTDALAMWNLEADQAGRVADVLAKGAAASSADINDLAQGLGNVGPIAAEFGLSLEDTVAILAAFSERGIKGAEAGTQLRSMLNNMTRDTAKVQGTWEELGIALYDAQGNMRPIESIMQDLSRAMDGMSDQERIKVIRDLGGSYGQLGLSVLTASPAMSNMSDLMDQQADAATVAEARLNNLNGIMSMLRSTIDTLLINSLGPSIENGLKPFLKQVIDVLNQVNQWVQLNPELTAQIIQVLAVLVGVGPALIGIGKGIKLVGLAFSAMGKSITLALGPVGWLIAAGAALYYAWTKNLFGFRDTVQEIFGETTNEFKRLGAAFKNKDAWGVLAGVGAVFDSLFASLFGFRTNVEGIFQELRMVLEPWFKLFGVEFKNMGSALLSGDLEGALEWAKTLFNNFVLFLNMEVFPRVQAWAAEMIPTMVQWVKDALPVVIEALATFGDSVITWLAETVPKIVAKLAEWASAFIAWVAPFVPPLLEKLGELIGRLVSWLAEQAPKLVDQLVLWGKAFIAWVGPQIPPLIEKLGELAGKALTWIGEQVPKVVEQLSQWANSFVDWVIPAAANLLLALPGLLTDLITWVLDATPDIIVQLLEWAAAFVEWVGPALLDLLEALGGLLGDVIEWILSDLVPEIIKQWPTIIGAFIDFVGESQQKIIPKLWDFLTRIITFFTQDLIPTVVRSATNIGESIVNGLWQGINNIWDSFKKDLEDKITGGIIGDAWGYIRGHSPSLVFMDIGESIVDGLALGLGNTNSLDRAMQGMLGSISPQVAAPVVAGASAGAGAGSKGGDTYQITLQITPDTIRQFPNAQEYGQAAGDSLAGRLQTLKRKAGGGVVTNG